MIRNGIQALALLVFIALLGTGCMGLGAAAIAGGIVYYKSSHHETAVVNLQAKPDRVFQVALETVADNPEFKIARQDDAARLLELKHGKRNVTLKVAALSPALAQLHVTSDVGGGAPGSTQAVLARVGEICDQLGIAHHVVEE